MPTYQAGLCQKENETLDAPYEAHSIEASSDAEAISIAKDWVVKRFEVLPETWLQVLLNGKAVHSEQLSAE